MNANQPGAKTMPAFNPNGINIGATSTALATKLQELETVSSEGASQVSLLAILHCAAVLATRLDIAGVQDVWYKVEGWARQVCGSDWETFLHESSLAA